MSKKNNRNTRARQREYDLKREAEQLQKLDERKTKNVKDKMKIDGGKIKKKQFKLKRKLKIKGKTTSSSQAMLVD